MMSTNYGLLAFDPMRSFLARNLAGSDSRANGGSHSPEAYHHSPLSMHSICTPKNYSNRSNHNEASDWKSESGPPASCATNNNGSSTHRRAEANNSNGSGASSASAGTLSSSSNGSDKDFLCELCLKRFTQKGNLKTHIRSVHTKEKPFTCHVCGKSFSQKGNMMTHVRTHNKDDRFPCQLCGKTFSQKGNLKTHMQRHSGDLPPCAKRIKKASRAVGGGGNETNEGGGQPGANTRLGLQHYPQPLDLVSGGGGRSSPGSSQGQASDDESSSSPLSELGVGQHHLPPHIPFPGVNGRDKWPVPGSQLLPPHSAAAAALYSSPMAWPMAHKNGSQTAATGGHLTPTSSSSQQDTSPPGHAHRPPHPSHHPIPYDHFSTLAAAAAASSHPAYSSFAANPLSRLSLFQGMAAAGMHASHLTHSVGGVATDTRPGSGDSPVTQSDSPRGDARD